MGVIFARFGWAIIRAIFRGSKEHYQNQKSAAEEAAEERHRIAHADWQRRRKAYAEEYAKRPGAQISDGL
jgi:hypothetical protein